MFTAVIASVVLASVSVRPGPDTPRPLLHFTPAKNWTNDPNGLIYLDGEYHVFYQYNPFGDQWGHMSWGHAVSKDLFTWEHLPVAIPEADGVMIFSGTAVYDKDNTSGFGKDGHAPLIAIYTGHDERQHLQYQCIAFSLDHGRTFTKYDKNPVIDLHVAEFRDPKVFWHAPTKRWIMVVSLAAEKKALFFASPDLKSWTKLSEFGPAGRTNVPNWECPDFFELPVLGANKESRWVLVINVGGNGPVGGSGTEYFVGSFDGVTFVNENPSEKVLWVDHGKDFYAFQTFQDAPAQARIGLAWMVSTPYAGATPTAPFRGQMTVPRQYQLRKTHDGIRLAQSPINSTVDAIKQRSGVETRLSDKVISGIVPTGASGDVAIVTVEFDPGTAQRFGVHVRESGTEFTAIGFDTKTRELFVDRRASGNTSFHPEFAGIHACPCQTSPDGHVSFTVVVDRTSVEAFSSDNLSVISSLIFPSPTSAGISAFAEGGSAKLVQFNAVAIPVVTK